jgi:catechol-2,3-dioxygenase
VRAALAASFGRAIRCHPLHIVIHAHGLARLARFWSQVLGRLVLSKPEREMVIGIDEHAVV